MDISYKNILIFVLNIIIILLTIDSFYEILQFVFLRENCILYSFILKVHWIINFYYKKKKNCIKNKEI